MSSPRSRRAPRQPSVGETQESDILESVPERRSPRSPRQSPLRESYASQDPEAAPARHSPRVTERQESPTFRSADGLKLRSPKLHDPSKVSARSEARRKRRERAALWATRWNYFKDNAWKEGKLVLAVAVVLLAINLAVWFNPYSPLKRPEEYDIDPGFSALHNLTNSVASHSTSDCLSLVLVRNALMVPGDSFQTAASMLRDGERGSDRFPSLKNRALAYAGRVANASAASQALFTSTLGLTRPLVSSLDRVIAELGAAPPYDANRHTLALDDPIYAPPQRVLARRKLRHLLAGYMTELASVVESQRQAVVALTSQLSDLNDRSAFIIRETKIRRERIAVNLRGRGWKNYIRLPVDNLARIFSSPPPPSSKREVDWNAVDALLNISSPLIPMLTLEREMNALHVFYNPADTHRSSWPNPRRQHGLILLLASPAERLHALHGEVVAAHHALVGRTAFWRGFLAADDVFVGVDNYAASLAQLKKELAVEPTGQLSACRKDFRQQVKELRREHGYDRKRFVDEFPAVEPESWLG